jgi:hypothetical protein
MSLWVKIMLFRRLAVAIALAFVVTGCGRSSQRDIEESRQTLRSWTTSIDFAMKQHAAQRVPAMFLPQLLKVANEALQRERRKIDNAPPQQRADLNAIARQLDSEIREQQARFARGASK